jgi:uncharacterized membrane protein
MEKDEMRWAGQVAYVGKKKNAFRVLVRKTEGKRQVVNIQRL